MAENEIRLHSDSQIRLPHPLDESDKTNPRLIPSGEIGSTEFFLLYRTPKAEVAATIASADPSDTDVVLDDVTGFSVGDLVNIFTTTASVTTRATLTISAVDTTGKFISVDLAASATIEAGRKVHRMVQAAAFDGSTTYGSPDVLKEDWGNTGSIPAGQPIIVEGDEITILWVWLGTAGGVSGHIYGETFVVTA